MSMYLPPLALVGLTFFCLFRLGYLRIKAVSAREISLRYFETYQGESEPEHLRIHSRHLVNLFEVPVLFYVITLINILAGVTTIVDISLAWSYVALRFLHTYIHLTTNPVALRFRVFVISALMLAALWVSTIAGILRQ